MKQLFLVFLGGGAGAVVRWVIGFSALRMGWQAFPLATLMANLTSCLILAIMIQLGHKINVSESVKLLLITGFCGGLSTFSTFSLETVQLIRNGFVGWAILTMALNVLCCAAILFWVIRK
jgi:CrcB protein